ncbi:MAG TPA: TetR/AcrR family transcriptional regulator [Firmicutes bacterium]|nr:TetR/AcrR family transcriptional regulator [Bacillota bacterium]
MEVNGIDRLLDFDHYLSEEIKAHKVMSVENEKRQRIITAAMQEFMKGYRNARTDTIVKSAGISKGLLFHYFDTKKELFFFLFQYAVDIIGGEYKTARFENRDFLDNIWQLSLLARKLVSRHPLVYGFLASAFFSFQEVFPGELQSYQNPVEELKRELLEKADRSLIRDDLDPEKALRIILWTVDGYSAELARLGRKVADYEPHYDEIEKELNDYLALLRKFLYKQNREEQS